MKSGVIRRMHRKPATKLLEKVPGHSHLSRRGARYYFRIGVPENLRSIVGRRELIKSLDTADFKTALERVSIQEQACREILHFARAQYEEKAKGKATPKPFEPLIITSEKQASELARGWFLEIEREGAQWWQENRQNISEEKRNGLLAELWHTQAAIMGECKDYVHPGDYIDGKGEVRAFLQLHHFKMDEKGDGFVLLARLFREARLEYVRRQQDRINGKPQKPYASLFCDLSENTPILQKTKTMTVKRLTEKFIEEYKSAGKAPKTVEQYQITANTLCELYGSRSAESITRDDAERFCDLLETMPINMVKKYPKMSTEAAIAKAAKDGDLSRLAANTRRNRFVVARAIFKYAADTRIIPFNPFEDRLWKARFTPKEGETEERPPFALEELKKIFTAPLYTGCKNDERGYAKPGPNVIRRGRFWVPLIGLCHGMRENEICQLHTADVGERDGILYLDIIVGYDKRLKNKPSKRAVPLHPELVKMGFLDYVAMRRADTSSLRLFPELKASKNGSYSDIFSKWFGNFLLKVFGRKIKPTFHSFRHSFKDYAWKANIPPHRIDRICGWSGEASRQQRHYGNDKLVPELAEEMARVKFEGLDLSHLYTEQPIATISSCRVRTRQPPIPPLLPTPEE